MTTSVCASHMLMLCEIVDTIANTTMVYNIDYSCKLVQARSVCYSPMRSILLQSLHSTVTFIRQSFTVGDFVLQSSSEILPTPAVPASITRRPVGPPEQTQTETFYILTNFCMFTRIRKQCTKVVTSRMAVM